MIRVLISFLLLLYFSYFLPKYVTAKAKISMTTRTPAVPQISHMPLIYWRQPDHFFGTGWWMIEFGYYCSQAAMSWGLNAHMIVSQWASQTDSDNNQTLISTTFLHDHGVLWISPGLGCARWCHLCGFPFCHTRQFFFHQDKDRAFVIMNGTLRTGLF